MSTRELLEAHLELTMAAAIRAAYPWVETGCTRDVPDLKTVDDMSPENTPLVIMDPGDEDYPEAGNGWTKVRLPIAFTGIVKHQDRLQGTMRTHANALLAVMQKTAWNYKHPTISVDIVAAGPSSPNVGQGQARPGLDVAFLYVIKDTDP